MDLYLVVREDFFLGLNEDLQSTTKIIIYLNYGLIDFDVKKTFTIRKFSRDHITFFLCPLFELMPVLKGVFKSGSVSSFSIGNTHSSPFKIKFWSYSTISDQHVKPI